MNPLRISDFGLRIADCRHSAFAIRHSALIRHSSFVIRHSAFGLLPPLASLTDSVSIAHFLVGIVAGVVGGIIGILTVGLRMGAWRQKVDDGLAALGDKILGQADLIARHEQMLRDGARRFDELPALASATHALTDQLKSTASILKDLVTKDRCNDRHAALERMCDERHKT